jgi:hypothetical protein
MLVNGVGVIMTKVVRAFSIDPHVSESLDHRVRKRGRSEYVNEALDWYLNKNLREYQAEVIDARNFLIDEINKKRVIIGGLEDDLESLKAVKACPSLWCRLKRLLQRSQVE